MKIIIKLLYLIKLLLGKGLRIEARPKIHADIADLAESFLGVKEITGKKNNPQIMEFGKAVTNIKYLNDETPWCSAFVNYCVKKCGLKGTDSALARSWLKWGASTLDKPMRGHIVVLKRGTKPWQGHVGFFAGWSFTDPENYVYVLGGNQSNSVSVKDYRRDDILDIRGINVQKKKEVRTS